MRLRITTAPAPSTPCTCNTDFAISRPIVLTSPMDGSPQCGLLRQNHPMALLMPQSGRRPQHQKQTFAVQQPMSALPPKADMCGATRDVRFGPIADIWLRELPPCSLSGPPDDPTAGEDKNCKCEPTVEAGINNVSGKQDYGYDHREIKRSSIAAMRATTASRI